jgi:hypothetical protein
MKVGIPELWAIFTVLLSSAYWPSYQTIEWCLRDLVSLIFFSVVSLFFF